MKQNALKCLITCFILLLGGNFTTYSQSKLMGGAKGVSGINKGTKKTSNEGSTTTPAPKKQSANKKTSVGDAKYSDKGYMDIVDVEFGNTDGSSNVISKYGSKLYASEVKYLTPKLVYNGLGKDSHDIQLEVRLYDGDGEMRRGTSSPEGCTYTIDAFTVDPGSNEKKISGWGSSKGGTFKPGEYKMEICYKGKVLISKSVRLYSGETPVVDNPILDIKNVKFFNENIDNNRLSDETGFYEGELYYICGDIEYVGKYKNDQNIKLYIKIFNSDGTLVRGDNSPEGYSYHNDLTIKQGANTVSTTGYGSKSGNTYKPGVVKIEYWLDGEKIYEGSVKVRDKDSKPTQAYVDLGLPSGTLWATCNVGASKPEEAGLYYAWGELEPKSKYTHSNSNYYKKSKKWLVDNSIINSSGNLTPKYDVATVKLGSSWRMPTVAETQELDEKCKWTWVSNNEINGFKLTGPNGNSIFLPATGWYNSASDGKLDCVGERSEYWSSSLANASDGVDSHCMFFMKPNTHYADRGHSTQCSRGLNIRPVYIGKK